MMELSQCPICGSNSHHSLGDTLGEQPFDFKWSDTHVFKNRTLSRCLECDSVFILEELQDTDLSLWYENAYRPTQRLKVPPHDILHSKYNKRYLSQAVTIYQSIELPRPCNVLEIGSNAISISPALSSFFDHKFYYYDQVSSDIIDHFGGTRLGSYFSKGCEEENKYDLLVSSHSLEHINPINLDETVKAMVASLKPGGYIFIEVPNDLDREIFDAPHTLFFSMNGLCTLFERNGLEQVMALKSPITKNENTPGSNKHAAKKLMTRVKEKIFNIILRTIGYRNGAVKSYEKLRLGEFARKSASNYDGRCYLRVIYKKPVASSSITH